MHAVAGPLPSVAKSILRHLTQAQHAITTTGTEAQSDLTRRMVALPYFSASAPAISSLISLVMFACRVRL